MAGSAMTFTFSDLSGGLRTYADQNRNAGIRYEKLVIEWTGDDATGDVSGTTALLMGSIVRIVTNPGTPAPNTDYDITLKDEDALDILAKSGDDLVDRSATVTESRSRQATSKPGNDHWSIVSAIAC